MYHFWHSRAQANWRTDADELKSAAALLELGSEAGKLGPYRFERIAIEVPEGFSAFAFAIPEMMDRWKARIREVAIDSACMSKRSYQPSPDHLL